MSFSTNKSAVDLSFNKHNFVIHFSNGEMLKTPLSEFPTIGNDLNKLSEFELFDNGNSIYFPKVDEYISVKNLMLGITGKNHG
ncbi:DUF2442 domain-containing protein [Cysteiniphilum sp. 19S12-1]|uniref:DUF2442 domain-containing protein n=1 Tax=Cysteiniphilum sp. 19S12-1 TaxID=3453130 RepID=UPI003F859688